MFWISCRRVWSAIALAVIAAVGLAGCGRRSAAPEAAPKTVADWFPIAVGARTVRMQLAILPAEQTQGLMGRAELGADDGMLFVYAAPTQMSFWMRNTPRPLDIGFFDSEGVLREVYPLRPFDETPVRSIDPRLKYALEMNQGWYAGNGVRTGARLDLRALGAALEARGMSPGDFGLVR